MLVEHPARGESLKVSHFEFSVFKDCVDALTNELSILLVQLNKVVV